MGFFFGRKKQNTTPAPLSEMQIQSSQSGRPIPLVYGTTRIAGNLLWYGDFKAYARTQSVGKGFVSGKTGSVTTYTYTVTVLIGICEGPITSFGRIWKDNAVYSYDQNSGTGAVQQLGMGAYFGTLGQVVWSYHNTNYPDQALNYPLTAYVAAYFYPLGQSAGLGNHSFEICGILFDSYPSAIDLVADVNAMDVVEDLLTNQYHGAGFPSAIIGSWTDAWLYCDQADIPISLAMTEQQSLSDWVNQMCEAVNISPVFSEGVLKMIPRSDQAVGTWTPSITAVHNLTYDDFVGEDSPITVKRSRPADAYNKYQVQYRNRANSYNSDIVSAIDQANVSQYGLRPADIDQIDFICRADIAQRVAQTKLQRILYVRNTYKFKLSWKYALLEPMDIVTITDASLGMSLFPVRITEIEEDEDGLLTVTAEEFPLGVASPTTYLVLQKPNDFDQSPWLLYQASLDDGKTDPYGGTAAFKLKENYTTHSHSVYQPIILVSGLPVELVVVAKEDDRTWVDVKFMSGTEIHEAWFDLHNIAVGTANGCTATINEGLGGYCECHIKFIPTLTSFYFVLGVASSDNGSIYSGDGTSGILLYSAQGYVSRPLGYSADSQMATPGSVFTPLIFAPPLELTNNVPQIWIAASGPNPDDGINEWGGCGVWISTDGSSYAAAGSIGDPAIMGTLHSSVATRPGLNPDETTTVTVDLTTNQQILTVSTTDFENEVSLCYMDGEYFCYKTSTLSGTKQYGLTYLGRHLYGSYAAAHSSSAAFAKLDTKIFKFDISDAQYGTTVYFKFTSFNLTGSREENIADVTAYSFAIPIPVEIDPNNMLGNPDFEGVSANGDALAFWNYVNTGSASGSISYSTSSPHSGSKCLDISSNVSTGSCIVTQVDKRGIDRKYYVTRGEWYRVSCWAKQSSVTGKCGPLIYTYDSSGTLITAVANSVEYTATASWAKYEFILQVPSNGAWIVAGVFSKDTTSDTFIDGMCLTRLGNYSSSSPLNDQGSIIPTQPITINYSSTTTSITLTLATSSIYLADGSTLTLNTTPTVQFTGLSPSHTYYIYPYISIADGVLYCTDGSPSASASATEAIKMNFDGRIGVGQMIISTPSSGDGGGSGGGDTCPEYNERVDVLGKGNVKAGRVVAGDYVRGYSFSMRADVYRRVLMVQSVPCASWRLINGHRQSPCESVFIFGKWMLAHEVPGSTFNMFVGRKIQIQVEADEFHEHNYYLVGNEELLIHNYYTC
jgi:hypothetical protein